MSIYVKLQTVRDAIRALNLKPTGVYKGTDRKFYQKSDFWDHAVKLFSEQGLITLTTSNSELAILNIVDISEPAQKILFTSHMASHNDRALSPVQNQGWGESYLYRRLYITALDLIESDPEDSKAVKPAKPKDVADRFNDETATVDPYEVVVERKVGPIPQTISEPKKPKGVRRGKA